MYLYRLGLRKATEAPVCCTVAHIERCVTSAWPGIPPGRITHTRQTGVCPLQRSVVVCVCYGMLPWNLMLLPWNLPAVTNKSFLFVCILGLGHRFWVLKAPNCSLPSESESAGRFVQAFYSEIRLLIILLIYVTLILQSFSECWAPYNRNTALLQPIILSLS